jgi:translation initiation factor IF-2
LAKRFYQIAFELGVPPRSLITELSSVGLSVGNQMVVVPPSLEDRIRGLHAGLRPLHPPREEEVAVAEPPPPPPSPSSRHLEEVPRRSLDDRGPRRQEARERVELPGVGRVESEPAPVETVAETSAPAFARGGGGGDGSALAASAPQGPTAAATARPAYRPQTPEGRVVQARPRAQGELVPTIDPRAGRLVREAPKTGIPGVTTPRAPVGSRGQPGGPGLGNLTPTLTRAAPAPGARRDSGSGRRDRESVPDSRDSSRHGKQTFQLRSRRRHPLKSAEAVEAPKSFTLSPPVPVKEFSEVSGIKVADVVKTLFAKHKQIVTPNSMLDEDTLTILALEFDRDIKFEKEVTVEDTMLAEAETTSQPEALVDKPPVVVVMGHVDHGKTTLLDSIRKTDVASHEAGGITQHIGAYQVTLPDGRKITFLDTPGHEAFTEMRRRGAQVTDVVVLVVAADDGVMPQTEEAIAHAKAADVPIVVALTKADKIAFNVERIDRVKQQLASAGILVEGWGGQAPAIPVSGTTGKGIDQLLEHIILVSEVEELKADPTRAAVGTVIEAENNPGRGVLATLLVENGTLRRGDPVLASRSWGRIRAMRDDRGQFVEEALPGMPVEVTGLDEVPEVGKKFYVRENVNEAREIAESRRNRDRAIELATQAKPTNLEGLFTAIEQGKVKAVKVVLKTDVKGSLEAIRAKLERLGNEEVKIQVVHSGVGAVNESDITLAAASGGFVVGFHVVADEKARVKAKHLDVDIRMHRIIYELEDEMKALLEGKLAPERRETILGHAEIRQVFRSTKLGNIAGCRVTDGLIRRDAPVRLAREGIVVWEGRIGSLRREKDDAREVKEGFECGIRLEGYDDIKEGDVVEAYTVESVARTLQAT